jgi:iron complex outermembrane receptor protein
LKLTSGVYDSTTEPFGLERLEVIKGASSVLYGQLGPGGLINAISKRPTDVPFGEVNASLGSYNRKEISGDVSGKLNNDGTLLYRFTGLARDSDTATNFIPDNKLYLAPSLTWRPDYNTSLTLLGYYQDVKTRFPTPLPEVGTLVPTSAGGKIRREVSSASRPSTSLTRRPELSATNSNMPSTMPSRYARICAGMTRPPTGTIFF